MADTIGDVFARGFNAGQGIGTSFSSMRFNRGAEKIRQKYEALATEEGRPLEDYRAQIQSDLDALETSSGARKRGVKGRDGRGLGESALDLYDQRASKASAIRAGQQVEAGDIAGSRRTLSHTAFGQGDYDTGLQNRQAAETIDASSAAVGKGPNGGYDAAGAAGALSGIRGRYGDMEGAQKADAASTGFRLNAASSIGGQLAGMLDNPAMFGDQIVGTFEGLKKYMPELANVDIRMDGKVPVLYQNGQATGSLDTPEEINQVKSMLLSFSRDPSKVLEGWMQQRMGEAQRQRERGDKIFDDNAASVRKVIEEFGKSGGAGAAQAAQGLVESQQKAAAAGWKFAAARSDGAIPATFGQRAFLILPPQGASEDGTPGYQSRIIDAATGQTVNPQELGQQGAALQEYTVKFSQLLSQQTRESNLEDLRLKINLLNQVGGQGGISVPGASRSGGGARSERNNNPGNIEDGPFARSQPGYKGSDGRFAIFDSAESGAAAQGALLASYGARGFNTIEKIVGRWSPQSDPTNAAGSTRNYAAYVARKLGVDPTQPLDLSNPQVATAVGRAMAEFESGNTSPVQPRQVAQAPVAPTPRQGIPASPAASQGVSSAGVRQRAAQMQQARTELQRWDEELAAFDRENPTQATPVFGRADNIQAWNRSGDPQVVQLRQQIVQARDQAKSRFEALVAATNQGAQALNAQTQRRGIDADFAAIKARVAGGDPGMQTAATNPAGNATLDSILRSSFR